MKMFLDKNNWEENLPTKWAGCRLEYHQELVSTNVTAASLSLEGASHGTLVVAERQTGGRGRRGRSWESPAGKSLYFSLLLRPEFEPEKASMLTLVMAHSVAKAVEQFAKNVQPGIMEYVEGSEPQGGVQKRAAIKWPNDILVNGKKVSGILTEMQIEKGRIGHVVIGVGINVMAQNFDGELAGKASTLEQEWKVKIDRAQLLRYIMQNFEQDYEAFETSGDLQPFLEYYHSRLLNKDACVKVLDPQEPFEGIARGITAKGELIVEKENGQTCFVYAGEVSVRGKKGYV